MSPIPATPLSATPLSAPAPRLVSMDRASDWLAAGWRDMWRQPVLSLGLGALYAGGGILLAFLLEWLEMGSLLLPACSGFMLIGPLAAVFFYEISRRLEKGEPITFALVARSVMARGGQIGNMGLVLVLLLLVWMLSGLVVFALFFRGSPPPLDRFVVDVLLDGNSLPFLIVGTVVGGALAAVAFAVSVFAMPMLLDRDVAVAEAITFSVRAARLNWRNMIGWAATIATVTFFGMAAAFVGLVLALPLVAHASWHAYRDIAG